ncbi:MAG TPA: outer membrane beta-barrel protein [Bacteroidia bacterium]|jgi:hypothetical protein|nr:outer membrane beta-barrel protein [Bacteroidia bacterium]
MHWIKKCQGFLFLLLSTTACYSQGSLKGKICDSIQVPVPFATLALLKQSDSSLVKGTLSDENGLYSFTDLAVGIYRIKVVALGFREQLSDTFRIDSTMHLSLAPIRISSSGHSLNEVSVSAIRQTIEFKNGNITVNVENSPLAKGNTVYDLLYKMPGVSIDANTITLQGKSGVIILIDGRTQQVSGSQLLTLLKSMNAESVEKIEILKNPPARYDASGTSGMIDIKTKKVHLLGISGSVYSSLSEGTFGNVLSGLSLNYKTKKITLFSGLDYTYNDTWVFETLNRKVTNGGNQTALNESNTHLQTGAWYNYKAGADWNPDKKNTLGFKIEGESGSSLANGNGTNTISGFNDLGFDHLQALQQVPDSWGLLNNNIHAEHLFDTSGTALNFSADYTILSEKTSSYNASRFYDAADQEVLPANVFQTSNNSLTRILASKLDFSKHVNPTTSFESGLKLSSVDAGNQFLFEKFDNTTSLFYTDTSQTHQFSYTESTVAAYFNYLKSFGKLNGQFGLRAENTQMQARSSGSTFRLNRNYLNLFPNISIQYDKSNNHNFQLNLNRRIDRPEYASLSPFRDYHDQYSYGQGNPFLLPHYSNSIEFTHSYKKMLVNSLSYTRIENVMLGYTEQNDTSKVLVENIKNMDYSESYTYSFFLQLDITQWWAMSANVVASYLTYKGDIRGKPFFTDGLYYNGYMTHTLLLPEKIKLELNSFYRGPKYNGIVLVKERWMFSLALKRTFFQGKFDCSVGITDIFNSGAFHTQTTVGNQDWRYYATIDSRRFVLSVHYNFGKLKLSISDKSSNEEEKGRLKH